MQQRRCSRFGLRILSAAALRHSVLCRATHASRNYFLFLFFVSIYIQVSEREPHGFSISFSFKMADKKLKDNLSRVKAPSPLGKSIFVGLRLTDAVWQSAFLHRGWASWLVKRLGGMLLQVLDASSGRLNPYYRCCCHGPYLRARAF